MDWKEANPLPAECAKCKAKDCYNCDVAGKRWSLDPADKLRLRKTGLLKAIGRMEREVKAIDDELSRIEKGRA